MAEQQSSGPALSVRALEKGYGRGMFRVLGGVSLDVGAHEIVALIGRSGAGKSTLLRCINRLVEPDKGEIVFEGVDVTKLAPKPLRNARRRIGMIFQEFNLVNRLTVLDNVLAGRAGSVSALRCWLKTFPAEDVARAEALLTKVGLIEHRFKRADELSGGQRQRVGIARALMQEPRLILADEPTASLDPTIGREIMELISSIAKTTGIPVLVSMHDVNLARRFVERIIALRDGVKVFDGNPHSADLDHIYSQDDRPSGPDAGENRERTIRSALA